jgi:UDP-glucose 4-epimerase
MNILVTGANGFIGRRLFARLKAQGHHVSGLSQDISKPFILKTPFDFVIHLAAYNITNVGAKDDDLYTAINVEGTKHLLQAVDVKKFIYLSTVKVYKNEGLAVTEDSPLAPQGAYEQSKLKAEEACRAFLKKESLAILRSVNVLGWGQAPKAVLPVFFQKAKANQALDIINSAHTPMQFVYVEDLIDAIDILISHKNVNGIFNIAHEETISLEQLARRIITMTHSSSVLNIPRDASEILFSPVICDKARQQLGWKAKTSLTKVLELYEEEYARNL